MSKPIPYLNEMVSLFVMLMMAIALIAGQAQATSFDTGVAERVALQSTSMKGPKAPLSMTFEARINGQPLTVSIDAEAEFSQFRLEDE